MGHWAVVIACREAAGLEPPFAVRWSGCRPGWQLLETTHVRSPGFKHERPEFGPWVIAYVADSDYALVQGFQDQEMVWEWVVTASDPSIDEATAAALVTWGRQNSLGNGTEAIAHVGRSGHVVAEQRVLDLLTGLEMTQSGVEPPPASHLRRDGSPAASRSLQWLVAFGQRGTPELARFMRMHHLEAWDESGAVLALKTVIDDPRAPENHTVSWHIYLATDPPVSLYGMYELGEATPYGPWQPAALEPETDPEEAATWARSQLLTKDPGPRADRPLLNYEAHGRALYQGSDPREGAYALADSPFFGIRLETLADLTTDGARLSAWLESVRRQILLPVLHSYADIGIKYDGTGAYDDQGPPSGVTAVTHGVSSSNRIFVRNGDQRGWDNLLKQLQRERLWQLGFSMSLIDSHGRLSSANCSPTNVQVFLRPFTAPPTGPLPPELPATIEIAVNPGMLNDVTAGPVREALLAHARQAIDDFAADRGGITYALGGIPALDRVDLIPDRVADYGDAAQAYPTAFVPSWSNFQLTPLPGTRQGPAGSASDL